MNEHTKANREASVLAALGNKIRTLREAQEMSQSALAQHIGVSEEYIASVERGEKNISVVKTVAIANALDVRYQSLFDIEPDTHDEQYSKLKEISKQLKAFNINKLDVLDKLVESIRDESTSDAVESSMAEEE